MDAWANLQVAQGTVVYHATTLAHANNIVHGGVQPVQNAFGGGRLGSGFYTHTNMDSATLYYQADDNPVILEFQLTRQATGQIAPQNVYVGTVPGLDYLAGNDFVTAEEDHLELKFHSGNCLRLVAVHWQRPDDVARHRYTRAEWEELYPAPGLGFWGWAGIGLAAVVGAVAVAAGIRYAGN